MLDTVLDTSNAYLLGLPMNENYRVIKFKRGDKTVYFSITRQGNAISMHIAAEKKSYTMLRVAANEMCEEIFRQYDWCECIFGLVGKQSVVNLAKKCGFIVVTRGILGNDPITVVRRDREWVA